MVDNYKIAAAGVRSPMKKHCVVCDTSAEAITIPNFYEERESKRYIMSMEYPDSCEI